MASGSTPWLGTRKGGRQTRVWAGGADDIVVVITLAGAASLHAARHDAGRCRALAGVRAGACAPWLPPPPHGVGDATPTKRRWHITIVATTAAGVSDFGGGTIGARSVCKLALVHGSCAPQPWLPDSHSMRAHMGVPHIKHARVPTAPHTLVVTVL